MWFMFVGYMGRGLGARCEDEGRSFWSSMRWAGVVAASHGEKLHQDNLNASMNLIFNPIEKTALRTSCLIR